MIFFYVYILEASGSTREWVRQRDMFFTVRDAYDHMRVLLRADGAHGAIGPSLPGGPSDDDRFYVKVGGLVVRADPLCVGA
jgi:hypothetical protein